MTSSLWKGAALSPEQLVVPTYTSMQMVSEKVAEKENEDITNMVDYMNMGSTTRAVVLAGGEQNNPLTKYRAMPAVPIGSCLTLIDVPINNCLRAGINKMYVMTQFQSHQLNSHIASAYPPHGFGSRQSGWVDVLAAQQTISGKEWYKGSADAIRRNLMELKDEARGVEPAEDYVILSGSAMYNMDIARVVGYHRAKNADITICTRLLDANLAESKGVVLSDDFGRVVGFHEKPGACVSDFTDDRKEVMVSMGVYVFKREALLNILERDNGGPMEHIGHHVIPAALQSGIEVFAYEHDGFWKDVSTLRDYYDANIALTSKSTSPIKFHELETAISSKKGKMLPPAKLCGTVEVDNSVLGDGSILSDGCISRGSIIGENVFVGRGSLVEESLLLGSPMWMSEGQREEAKARGDMIFGIGKNTHLKGCIIDVNAYVGNDCIIRNDEGIMEADMSNDGYMIQEGIVVVLKNAIIPDGTVI
jgi:glucose-1-phosphate adenylyltransferase